MTVITQSIALLFDVDRSLIEKKVATFKAYCKLGKHGILHGQETIWLRSPHPLGLSCLPCATRKAPEVVAELLAREPVRPAAKVKPDRTRLTHGTSSAYNRGCRCEECTAANTARSVAYKAARRQRQAAA